MGVQHIDLVPPLVEAGKFQDLVQSGHTILASLSPRNNSLAVNVAPLELSSLKPSDVEQDEAVYFATHVDIPSSERRLFIADTLVVFSMFKNMLKSAKERDPSWLQTRDGLEVIRKFGVDYVNFIKECWIHANLCLVRNLYNSAQNIIAVSIRVFSLFVVLFVPEPGYEDAPVGEELMEWLNIHFIEPSTEEGDQLSSLESPWEDDNFWPYLTRSILRGLSKASLFFLNTLLQHPSEDLQDLVKTLIPVVESQPRLPQFSAERDFAYASRKWKDKVKALRVEMDRIPEGSRFDDFYDWWEALSDIVSILEGRGEVVQRVCEELGADWKEVCAAWGIFVDSRLRRQDLPDVVADVLETLPPDPTNLEEMIHSSLFAGHPEEALKYASDLDLWLSAHLADIMVPLGLLDPESDSESGLSKRDEHVLAYAEYLHSDATLWRITIVYLYTCGTIGEEQGDQVLMRMPLRLSTATADTDSGDQRLDAVDETMKEISSICREYSRELVRRTVCRIASSTLKRSKKYGLAMSHSISAEDWPGLGRIIDAVLDEYIQNGPVIFASHASTIAPLMEQVHANTKTEAIFAHRLMFAVKYSQIHKMRLEQDYSTAASDLVLLLRDEIAPKSWWAILLCDSVEYLQYAPKTLLSPGDAIELLRKLEEICMRSSQGSGEDYLPVLVRTMKGGGGEKEALERLKTVRLAIARYIARCTTTLGGMRHFG
ncbi:Nup85 nucleoporin-domain-containing protein [Rhodocollybia butyracea]|uniref:Nuclear pore complex protein Nup85 n=1 Tax=Rhodocollybia butyracea TaxID=206335 RepID=A0A9P5UG36_9AGAR|nr:Nup85 nucleoporin-domain-containing protein [Rhodocollybia butyracea]